MKKCLTKIIICLLFQILFLPSTGSLLAQYDCDFIIDVSPTTEINEGDSLQIFVFSTLPAAATERISWSTVEWTPDNILSCNDCYDPYVSTTADVCILVSVRDTSGCTVSDTTCVVVRPTNVELYPNPVRDILFLESNGYPVSYVEIYNGQGQVVKSEYIREDFWPQGIRVSEFASGVYYINIWMEEFFKTEKFVKR